MERADYERTVEGVRSRLDDQAFQAAWDEGCTMTPEQALAAPERAPVHHPAGHPSGAINRPPTPVYPDGLTAREVEVLRLLAAGLTVAQIAEHFVISPRTVSTHITSIYRKIGVNSRSAATRYAIERKLV
jgi:DNA-binding NarL/FixJ family response regulator